MKYKVGDRFKFLDKYKITLEWDNRIFEFLKYNNLIITSIRTSARYI